MNKISYVSQSLLSQRAEGQDDSDDGHPLQHAVHSYKHTQTENNPQQWIFDLDYLDSKSINYRLKD